MTTHNPCPCMDCCPLENALTLIGGKWKIRIICALSQSETTRYNELKRRVEGITNTMLASSLKELEQANLIMREQFPEMPVRVEYTLTKNARALLPILSQIANWGLQIKK